MTFKHLSWQKRENESLREPQSSIFSSPLQSSVVFCPFEKTKKKYEKETNHSLSFLEVLIEKRKFEFVTSDTNRNRIQIGSMCGGIESRLPCFMCRGIETRLPRFPCRKQKN